MAYNTAKSTAGQTGDVRRQLSQRMSGPQTITRNQTATQGGGAPSFQNRTPTQTAQARTANQRAQWRYPQRQGGWSVRDRPALPHPSYGGSPYPTRGGMPYSQYYPQNVYNQYQAQTGYQSNPYYGQAPRSPYAQGAVNAYYASQQNPYLGYGGYGGGGHSGQPVPSQYQTPPRPMAGYSQMQPFYPRGPQYGQMAPMYPRGNPYQTMGYFR